MGKLKLTAPRLLKKDDDIGNFDCGEAALNHWFQRHAWGNQSSGATRTYVVMEAETGYIAGYIALTTGHVERECLTKQDRRNKPNPVPILLLGQLAIDVRYQGQGLGSDLLQYAFRTAIAVSEKVGVIGIVTHPINDNARQFYQRYGFSRRLNTANGALFVRIKDLRAVTLHNA